MISKDTSTVIHCYSRSQAIEDGVLVDVSRLAKEAGVKYPMAVTARVWNEVITPNDDLRQCGQSEIGRLWDMLNVFRVGARKTEGSQVLFGIHVLQAEGHDDFITLKAICGPGDTWEPVITVMMPDED